MDSPDERARAQGYWRTQLQLTCLAGVAFLLTVGSTQLVLADFGRDPQNRPLVVAALAVSALGLAAVLGLLLVHVFRVAAFTFRRGDS
jgi:hypothetical protein